jgi:molecular chaperone Hsp33
MDAPSCTRRFLLENLDIRGQVVCLRDVWQAIAARRDYAPAVRTLLGEFAAVSVMVGAGLKHPGRALLQVSGPGPIRMLVADCTDALALRGMIRMDAAADPNHASLPGLIGGSRLALTIENAVTGQMYQSIVPVEGITVAEVFEQYLDRSEQVPTHLWIGSTPGSVTALILQKMPKADERDADGWARVQLQAATGFAALALRNVGEHGGHFPGDVESLLSTLFPDDDIRLYAQREVKDGCARNEEKVIAMLKSLGRDELEATVAEHGEVVVRDEICNHEYRFGPAAVSAFLEQGRGPESPRGRVQE